MYMNHLISVLRAIIRLQLSPVIRTRWSTGLGLTAMLVYWTLGMRGREFWSIGPCAGLRGVRLLSCNGPTRWHSALER
jgi:hypothetical protein